MSARMEPQTVTWEQVDTLPPDIALTEPTQTELESLFRNFDHKNLVAPLREVRAAQAQFETAVEGSEEQHRAALDLQQRWESWLVQREVLRSELKRGKEALEQSRGELTLLRGRLEDWTRFESVCGKNPLVDYMGSIVAHEKLQEFLPGWLKRKEAQLQSLNQSLEDCARENDLEHLL
jgi:hypothetical protein